jgi:serine protease AprX
MIVRCPICKHHVQTLLRRFRGKAERTVVTRLQSQHPGWSPRHGMCERCLYLNEFPTLEDHFRTMESGSLFRLRAKNEFALLPTPLRLNADPRFTGKGVTIAFIDSGFYPHPDLTSPRNRVRAIIDVTDERKGKAYFNRPHVESWHGTMTSVAAAGNGHLMNGLYRGIASEADVVLIKVLDSKTKKIAGSDIARGIHWAIDHRERYNIRIISISVGDDEPTSLAESQADQAAEEAVAAGITVVAAIGNTPERPVVPPASSPSVITVGGVNDLNQLRMELRQMYHSTFGTTVNGHAKPELIAPAMWLAGPILPHTDQFREAPVLFSLLQATTAEAERIVSRYKADLPTTSRHAQRKHKEWVRGRIKEMKYIAPYYKHVDGTSFAAPIVSSIVAQMLEANPSLQPGAVKRILIDSADIVETAPRDQQGHGVPNARRAVETAMRSVW